MTLLIDIRGGFSTRGNSTSTSPPYPPRIDSMESQELVNALN